VGSTSEGLRIHSDAWRSVAERAEVNPYYKYGIYVSRIMAVKHPEVYLQADRVFLESIDGITLDQRVPAKDSLSFGFLYFTTFNFKVIDPSRYEIVSCREIYRGMPYLPTLDQRAFSLSSMLKRFDNVRGSVASQNRATQLNAAILRYLRSSPGRDPYIILTDSDTAYVADEVTLSVQGTVGEPLDGSPILVFNEGSVWYPLMGRDDTAKDPSLRAIVDRYSRGQNTSVLTEFEVTLIRTLETATP
jgi:hypothetical protein